MSLRPGVPGSVAALALTFALGGCLPDDAYSTQGIGVRPAPAGPPERRAAQVVRRAPVAGTAEAVLPA